MKKMMFLALAATVLFSACTMSYNIIAHSDNVEALDTVTFVTINSSGNEKTKTVTEGIFKGKDYDTAIKLAHKAGYNKILSVEYGVKHFLFLFWYPWVTVRCAKETTIITPSGDAAEQPEPHSAEE